MAEDRDHDIAVRSLGNLLLKRRVRLVELEFPADRLETRKPGKFAVQPLHHAVDTHAFELRVARG